jgi:hypothetical protein
MKMIAGHDDKLTPVERRAWQWALRYPFLRHDNIQDMIDALQFAWQASLALDPATIIAALKKTRRKKK